MKKLIPILLLLLLSLFAQAWPNNLVFTLQPLSEIKGSNTIGFELITDKAGVQFIGKFKRPSDAEKAQEKLANIGIDTEMCAFFRARPIGLEDALILAENMNPAEEKIMLTKTKNEKSKSVIISNKDKKKIIIETKNNAPGIIESDKTNQEIEAVTEVENNINIYYSIQLGVFSKSAKSKFAIDVNEIIINQKYYCFYGNYNSFEKAEYHLEMIKQKGYSDAFIAGIDNGKKVNPQIITKKLNHSL